MKWYRKSLNCIYIEKSINIYYSRDKEADVGDIFSGEKYK